MTQTTTAIRMDVFSRPRLGFLGVGWIGRSRLEAIQQHGRGDIAAIMDVDRAAAEKAAKNFSGTAVCETFQEMLDIGIDGVVIATPSALHFEHAVRALEHGLAVYCQKPLGTTASETRSIIDSAILADRLIGIDLSYRHLNGMREIRRRVGNGDIGRIFAVDLVFHNAYGPDKPWYYDPVAAGGGCVMDLGVHLIDLLLWVLDFPAPVSASGRMFSNGDAMDRPGVRVEDYAAARLDLENGVTATLACSWNLPAGCDAVIRIAFFGSEGGLCLSNINGSFFDFETKLFRKTTQEVIAADSKDTWWGRSAVDWVNRLSRSRRYDPEAAGIIPVAFALESIYASAYKRPHSGRTRKSGVLDQ
ncbi:MAG: Gfo/Idh/MocA family oxidoreductase [Desulfobacterales bacterium]